MAFIMGVGGSPRKNGNSDKLLKQALAGCRETGAKTETVFLRDYMFSGCIGCEKCRKSGKCTGLNDGMQILYPLIEKADGLILACPTHNYNVTAWMKAFIDRLYCYYIFTNDRPRQWSSRLAGQGRKASLIAICEQVDEKDMGFTLPAMRTPMEALGHEVIEELPVFAIFDSGAVAKSLDIMEQAKHLGKKLAQELAAKSSLD
jgi:multimeric flavodoxin WrbA